MASKLERQAEEQKLLAERRLAELEVENTRNRVTIEQYKVNKLLQEFSDSTLGHHYGQPYPFRLGLTYI